MGPAADAAALLFGKGDAMKHEKMILVLCACLMVLGFGVSALVGIWRMYQEGTQEYKGLQEFVSEEYGKAFGGEYDEAFCGGRVSG